MDLTIQLDPALEQVELFGTADAHLRMVRDTLGVRITARRNTLIVSGEDEKAQSAQRVLEAMQRKLVRKGHLQESDVKELLASDAAGVEVSSGDVIRVFSNRKTIEPNTNGQKEYIRAMQSNDVTFCIGPAGTGKTYLAVAIAVAMLKRKQIRRIVLARPAVEAGEKLGFLPGDLQAKVNPYLRPLFDALEDMMEFGHMRKLMDLDIIEIIPLAFMRGRTLNDAAVICDEAQNTSPLQMLMMLTRLGHGSKMIITGDVTQIDLPRGQECGLIEAINILKDVPGIGHIQLTQGDIVRHRLVQNIVRAYKQRHEKIQQDMNESE